MNKLKEKRLKYWRKKFDKQLSQVPIYFTLLDDASFDFDAEYKAEAFNSGHCKCVVKPLYMIKYNHGKHTTWNTLEYNLFDDRYGVSNKYYSLNRTNPKLVISLLLSWKDSLAKVTFEDILEEAMNSMNAWLIKFIMKRTVFESNFADNVTAETQKIEDLCQKEDDFIIKDTNDKHSVVLS